MGGNALTEGLTERKSREDYLQIKALVLETLRNSQADCAEEDKVLEVISEIIEMPEKQSFGDLDLLYVSGPGRSREEVHCLVRRLFSPTEIVMSGSVTSFDFMRFQIDLIHCTSDSFGMSHFCLSYGDRGMILGQMAKCRGFSLGTKGLVVTHSSVEQLLEDTDRDRDQRGTGRIHLSPKSKIVLSTDPEEIRAFMGLPAGWSSHTGEQEQELLTQADVMSFCEQCPWFQPRYFAPRRLGNCESKKKLKQRPFYRLFCEHVARGHHLGE
jgi:hypothetical protein